MERTRIIVFTDVAPGHTDAEFNAWYDQIHLKEVLDIPGCVAAQRFKLADAQLTEGVRHRYLAIYEFEVDADAARQALQARKPFFQISESLQQPPWTAIVEPITPRREVPSARPGSGSRTGAPSR